MADSINIESVNRRYEVSPLELFFDLVFAFAVSQLSHHLFTHFSDRGVIETLVMLLAIFTVWSYTSWAATMIRIELVKTRIMILVVMFFGLFMNASITGAFTSSGWPFVVPLLIIQLGRTVWTILNSVEGIYREHYKRVLIWFLATAPLWVTGAAVKAEMRLVLWGAAAGIELTGTLLANPIPGRKLRSINIEFDVEHLLERCRLFLLIALGETVLSSGSAISGTSMGLMTIVTGLAALSGIVALWDLTFGRSHGLVLLHIDKTSDPIHAGRHAVNALIAMVAGLIASAVANEKVILSPGDSGSAALNLLLFGGPVLFLSAQGWYLWMIIKFRPLLHIVGIAALIMAGIATLSVSVYIAMIMAACILAVIAISDRYSII